MQAERWLESLLLEDVERLFPELLPQYCYSQAPVYLGSLRGNIDLLCADRRGSLVVMEIKVDHCPDLPLQSLDYWGRVYQHNLNGDFERKGFFPGSRFTRLPPKIYLISPVFSYHD